MKSINRFRITILLLILAFACIPMTAAAGDKAADAQALVKKAISYVQDNGKEAAIAAFNDAAGEFVRDDLYIFMFDYDGVTLAHGANPRVVGKNLIDLKDSAGTAFVQEFIKMAKNGGGWVDYKWTNPETRKVQDKSTYIMDIPGTGMFLGCGIYK